MSFARFTDPGLASGRLLGPEPPDHLQRVADVLADVGHRVEHVPDLALAVDHVGDPPGYQAEQCRHSVTLPDSSALVAEQRERQVVSAGEGSVTASRVRTDPDHLGPGLGEDLVAVAEGARLGGTAWGVVLGIEV